MSDCVVDRVLEKERLLPPCDVCGGPPYAAEGRSRGDWQPWFLVVCGDGDSRRCLQSMGKTRRDAAEDWLRLRDQRRENRAQRARDGERIRVTASIDGWWEGDECYCRHDGYGFVTVSTPTYRHDGKPRQFRHWQHAERMRPVCWLIECVRCARLWPNRWKRKDYWGDGSDALCGRCWKEELAHDRQDRALQRALSRTYDSRAMINKMEKELRHG